MNKCLYKKTASWIGNTASPPTNKIRVLLIIFTTFSHYFPSLILPIILHPYWPPLSDAHWYAPKRGHYTYLVIHGKNDGR